MPHLAMKSKATIVPNGNQVASGARSSATDYGLRPTCHPFTRHLRPARTATPTKQIYDTNQNDPPRPYTPTLRMSLACGIMAPYYDANSVHTFRSPRQEPRTHLDGNKIRDTFGFFEKVGVWC